MTEKYAFIDRGGCGEVAFFIDHMPTQGETAMAESVEMPDGIKPKNGDNIECGSCQRRILKHELRREALKRFF